MYHALCPPNAVTIDLNSIFLALTPYFRKDCQVGDPFEHFHCHRVLNRTDTLPINVLMYLHYSMSNPILN